MDNRPANVWALQTVRRLWADFMAREPGTLRGEDPEQLHRMRVAHRRLRTAIGSFAAVLPPDLPAADAELRWIGGELGEVRDLDVQIDSMHRTAESLEASPETIAALLAALHEERNQARQRMLESLVSKRFEALVLRIARTLREQVPAGDAHAVPSIGRYAPAMLKERYKRFRKAARRIGPRSQAIAYHDVRRRARRLRFATEFVEEIYGEPAQDLVEALVALQDLFGEHQDCVAAIDLRRRVCKGLPAAALVLAHEIDDRDRERAASIRKDASDVIKRVEKRWKALERLMKG